MRPKIVAFYPMLWLAAVAAASDFQSYSHLPEKHLTKREIDADDLASFFQQALINPLLKNLPFGIGSIISAFLVLFKAMGPKEISLYDKIMNEVERKVKNGVTDYHKDNTYAKLKEYRNNLESIDNFKSANGESWVVTSSEDLRQKLYTGHHYFDPLSFSNSTGYNPAIIMAQTHFLGIYMSVSLELESSYKLRGQQRKLGPLLRERNTLLNYFKSKALELIEWARDQREGDIECEAKRRVYQETIRSCKDRLTGQRFSSRMWVWTRYNYFSKMDLPMSYFVVANKLREEAADHVVEYIFKPLNVFLKNAALPLLPLQVIDQKTYDLNIYGYNCVTPCSKDVYGNWNCKPQYGGTTNCSPDGQTYRGEACTSSCEKSSTHYNWCYTRSSWDYCSPQQNKKNIFFPSIHMSLTIENEPCRSTCTNNGGTDYYYWCKTDRSRNNWGGWNYCSKPENSSLVLTQNGKPCSENVCTLFKKCYDGIGHQGSIGTCIYKIFYNCQSEGKRENCSPNYKSHSSPMPATKDCKVVTRPDGSERCVDSNGFVVRLSLDLGPGDELKLDDNWFLVNILMTEYHNNPDFFLSPDA